VFKCPLCKNQYEKLISLSVHYRKGHKKKSKDLIVDLYYNGREPTCACGCGGEVKFLDITRGFREFIHGHAARIPEKNNFVSNKAQQNSAKTRKKMIESGGWKPFHLKETSEHWGKGLSKETDDRIAKMANSIKTNKVEIEKRSKRMRKGRLDGTIPTLHKENHSQWKGGISPLNQYCRSSIKLYSNWKYPLLKAAKFQCVMCKKPGPGLEIHHNKETMSSIIRKFAKKFKWDHYYNSNAPANDQNLINIKDQIAEAVADYHIQNNVSGVVLCSKCHSKEHN